MSRETLEYRDSEQLVPVAAGSPEPAALGLPLTAWLKVGVLGALLAALFWANLVRLWLKTNPFTGSGNWEHAIFIPIVGLYYLYVWRDKLRGRETAPAAAELARQRRWTLPGIWALVVAAPLVLLLAVQSALSFSTIREWAAHLEPSTPIDLVVRVFIASLWLAAAAVWVYLKQADLVRPPAQHRLDRVWRTLGVWIMAMVFAWGIGFIAWVLTGGTSSALVWTYNRVVAVGGIAGLVTAAWFSEKPRVVQTVDRLLRSSATWFGLFVMLFGILFSFWGIWPGRNDFFKDVGMVVALFGVTTLVGGWRVISVAWFPIVFLFCALPWPDQVYSWVALPLQNFAAKIGVFALQLTGVDATKFGTKISFSDARLVPQVLNVEEACAGLKSLMTFISVSAAVAFLSSRLLWQKLVIVAAAVPIAIACNAGRVAGQGLLHRYVDVQWSQNFAHSFAGLVMLIPGFFLILLVGWLLDRLFVEVTDDVPAAGAGRQKRIAATTAPASFAPTGDAAGGTSARGSLPRGSTAARDGSTSGVTPVRVVTPAGGSLRPTSAAKSVAVPGQASSDASAPSTPAAAPVTSAAGATTKKVLVIPKRPTLAPRAPATTPPQMPSPRQQPASRQAVDSAPVENQPLARPPSNSNQPVANQPVANQPAANRPVPKQPAVNPSAAPQEKSS